MISPSSCLGSIFPHRLDRGVAALEALGFRASLAESCTTPNLSVSHLANEIHSAVSEPEVGMVLFAIGGLNTNKLLPLLDFELIARSRKIFCGYSDATVLHCALLSRAKLLSFYGPCLMTQFAEYPAPMEYVTSSFLCAVQDPRSVQRILPSQAWTDEVLDWGQLLDLSKPRALRGNGDGHQWLRGGSASGPLLGGCFYSLHQLKGTPYLPSLEGAILLLELPPGQALATGYALSYFESQLNDLVLSGIFKGIRGLVIGRPPHFSSSDYSRFAEVLQTTLSSYSFPILLNINAGHADPIATLPLGVDCALDSQLNLFELRECPTSGDA